MFALRHSLLFAALSFSTASFAKGLKLEVFASDGPGFHATSTLIEGEKEAILIDGQFTRSAAHHLAAKILESGKELTAVYMTHSHPDHFFGMEVIRGAFPNVKLYATTEVAEQARSMGPQKLTEWKPLYGRNLTDAIILPEVYAADTITLEGETINIIKLKPGEVDNSVIYHVPSLNAVIAGDAVYNGVHPWLAEANAEHRKNWLENLATIRALKPKIVVAGHRAPSASDSPKAIEFTAAYVKDFDQIAAKATSDKEITAGMLKKYGKLQLPIILDIAAKAAVKSKAQ